MRALVTGATGFVGGNLARALLNEGVAVRALVRRQGPHRALDGLPVEQAQGDLEDVRSLGAAMRGCDVVFHAAALNAFWHRDRRMHHRVNVDGARNVLAAARHAGVGRVVHTSTWAVVGRARPGCLADEATPPAAADLRGPYRRTKWLAEQAALEAAAEGQDVVVVSPTVPVGRGDVKPTPTGRIVLDFLRGRMPAVVQAHLNLVDVADVAQGHIGAWRRGRGGERYILGNWNTTLPETLNTLADITGKRAPRLRLPLAAALAAAWVDTVIEGVVLRRPPLVPLEGVQHAIGRRAVTSGKAVAELGMPQSPVTAALEGAVRWFTDNGYVNTGRRAW